MRKNIVLVWFLVLGVAVSTVIYAAQTYYVDVTGTVHSSGVDVTGDLSMTGNATITGTMDVTGDVTLTGNTTTIQNATNNTTALQVNNSGGGIILGVDTSNDRVGILTSTPSASLDVSGDLVAAGSAGITGALDVTGDTTLTGNTTTIQNTTNNTTALQVNKSGGGIIFNVDTTNDRVGILTTTSSATLDVSGDVTTTGDFTVTTGGVTRALIDPNGGYLLGRVRTLNSYDNNLPQAATDLNAGTIDVLVADSATGVYDVTGDIALSRGTFWPQEGFLCRWDGTSDYTLNIACSIQAGDYQWIDDSSSCVVFQGTQGAIGSGAIKQPVHLSWFGFDASDGTSTYQAQNVRAWDNCINAMPRRGNARFGHIMIPCDGEYQINDTLTVPQGCRGLTIEGCGNYHSVSVIKNMNTGGNEAIHVDCSDDICYGVTLKNFTVEGNDNFTDGDGIYIDNCIWCNIENIYTEATGAHGFHFKRFWSNSAWNLRARQAGVDATNDTDAGFYFSGNVGGEPFYNLESQSCNIGLHVASDSDVVIHGFDLNQGVSHNKYRSILTHGNGVDGGSLKIVDSYIESDASAEIGDGANWMRSCKFIGVDFGSSGALTFNNVREYAVENCRFADRDFQIEITDPNDNTFGTTKNNIFSYVDTVNLSSLYHFSPDRRSIKNMLVNGSLEQHGDVSNDFPGWFCSALVGATGSIDVSTDSCPHDAGRYSALLNHTNASDDIRLLYRASSDPEYSLIKNRLYTLAFSYKTSLDNKLEVTLNQGDSYYLNGTTFAASPTAWRRVGCRFRADYTTFPSLQFVLADATGDCLIDAIALYAGTDDSIVEIYYPSRGIEWTTYAQCPADSTTKLKAAQQNYTSVTSFDAEIALCRTVSITTDATADPGTVTFSGINWAGQWVTEDVTTDASLTRSTDTPFLKLLKVSGYDAGAGGSASVGVTDTVGLPKRAICDDLTSPIILITRNGVEDSSNITYNYEYNTITFTTLNASDDVSIGYYIQ